MRFLEILLEYEEVLTGKNKRNLADYVKVTTRTINNWINENNPPRKKVYLYKIAEFFKISYKDFFNLQKQYEEKKFNLSIEKFQKLKDKEN